VSAGALLADLAARGVTLKVVGAQLRFPPRGAVPLAVRLALVAHKAEVLELLRRPEPPSSLPLDRVTLCAVLGPRPDRAAIAELETEVHVAMPSTRPSWQAAQSEQACFASAAAPWLITSISTPWPDCCGRLGPTARGRREATFSFRPAWSTGATPA
jgi:hypothetical protein